MKVLFLVRRKNGVGGVEKHVQEVGRVLRARGYEVRVVDESEILEKEWLACRQWFKKFYIWQWLWQNRAVIEKADIIHAHDVAFWYFPFRFLYPRKRFYVTFHGWEGKFPVPWKNKLVRKISEKLAWGNICVGDFIEKWYGTKPNAVTYGGVKCRN